MLPNLTAMSARRVPHPRPLAVGWISQPLSNKNTQPMKYHPCQPRHAALALLLVGLAAPTAQAALPAGTQGYYSFNNAADLGADLSANANHLSTATGAPSFSASGKLLV